MVTSPPQARLPSSFHEAVPSTTDLTHSPLPSSLYDDELTTSMTSFTGEDVPHDAHTQNVMTKAGELISRHPGGFHLTQTFLYHILHLYALVLSLAFWPFGYRGIKDD